MKTTSSHYHVVYIITKLELGGAQKVCLALMDGLEQQNIAVSLISGTEGILINEAKKHSSIFLMPSLKREVGIRSLWGEIKNFFIMTKILRKLKKSNKRLMIHTHSTKAGIVGRWAAFFAGIDTRIHTVHGFGFHNHQNHLSWLLTYVCEFLTSFITTQFICVSLHDIQTGKKLLPRFARKHILIRAAVDDSRFIQQKTVSTHPTLIIGTISCFKPQKNLFDLLTAFKLVHEARSLHQTQPLELHIIGDGIMRKNIEAWIEHHNLGNNIKLLGWQDRVEQFLSQWSIFALSSLWEGLPCAIIEARLCKLPVVAYNVGGISEVIFDHINGFLIPVGNVEDLARKLLNLIDDDALRIRLSTYQDDLKDFQKDEMARKHCSLYEHLAARKTSFGPSRSNTSP